MAQAEFIYDQPVLIPWGPIDTVLGHVEQVYGSGPTRMVIVRLQPEESGFVVGETTTVTFPIDRVKPAPTTV